MSRSNETFGPTGQKQRWCTCTPRRRCPVCNGDSWCSIRADGVLVACRRNSYGQQREDRNGESFWLHCFDGRALSEHELPPECTKDRACLDSIDEAYRALLAQLSLTQEHRASLERRGLDRTAITRGMYRTLPAGERHAIGRRVSEHVSLEGVPGFFVHKNAWIVGGAPGLLVPLRDLEGRIVALKIRRDDPGEGPRYLYFSSTRHGGPSAVHALHVPVSVPAEAPVLRITEGELKADVATHLSGVPTLSVPGVGSWRLALEAAKQRKAERVQVAFDADWRTNANVCRATIALGLALKAAGYIASQLVWDPNEGKGIDDHLTFLRTRRAA